MKNLNVAFEKWFKANYPKYDRYELKRADNHPCVKDGAYLCVPTRDKFTGYEAAMAENATEIAELNRRIADLEARNAKEVCDSQQIRFAKLHAHINELRDALHPAILALKDARGITPKDAHFCRAIKLCEEALASTPMQSLKAHNDKIMNKCYKEASDSTQWMSEDNYETV